MLLVCIFIIIILGIITVKRPRTIIWMGRYIRNKLLLLLLSFILRIVSSFVQRYLGGQHGGIHNIVYTAFMLLVLYNMCHLFQTRALTTRHYTSKALEQVCQTLAC